MGELVFDGIYYRVDGQTVEPPMVVRRYDEVAGAWFEGKVCVVRSWDHGKQQYTSVLSLAVEGYAPSPLEVGDTIEIVSKAELYNREMDERNRIIAENREKPWLPFYDAE